MLSNVNIQQLFTLGPQNINGSAIPDVQNLAIDFAPVVSQLMGSEDTAPTFLTIDSLTPRITLDTLDPSYMNTYGFAGTAQNSSATNCYLQKLTKGAGRLSAGTSQHIKFSLSSGQGQIVANPASASENSNATCQLVITPISGSSAILTISNASAIT